MKLFVAEYNAMKERDWDDKISSIIFGLFGLMLAFAIGFYFRGNLQ